MSEQDNSGFPNPSMKPAEAKRLQNESRDAEEDSSTAYLLVVLAFVGGIGLWFDSHGILFRQQAIWLLLMGLATLGMRMGGRSERAKLARLTEEATRKWQEEFEEQQVLDACRLRRERRSSIRAGEITDDGLSEFGRALVVNPQLTASVHKDEEKYGSKFPSREENIFDTEESDKKLEAAWERKLAADTAWRKVLFEN
jgi:hypothetical protein